MIDLTKFKKLRIGVLGDIMVDKWVWGEVTRVSPEAPALVFKPISSAWFYGGAANVASNIRSLGGNAFLFGVVGREDLGAEVFASEATTVTADTFRITTQKTRFVAANHHLLRVDEESPTSMPKYVPKQILSSLRKKIKTLDGLILSDYNKGVLTDGKFIGEIMGLARDHKIPVFVDTKKSDANYFQGAALLVPNAKELSHLSGGLPTRTVDEITEAVRQAELDLTVKATLVKRGKDGMVMYWGEDKNMHHQQYPSLAESVVDVSGAGDTVLAAVTLSYLSGFTLEECMVVAASAAALAVRRPGTYAVTQSELYNFIDVNELMPVSTP